ncbi:MAG TPA: formate/nitrite transporter family protein [Thermoanaerobaculia bacterium]|nr:formate/nitrite transporter family protein [Thermoanaerobaculia bacterium]
MSDLDETEIHERTSPSSEIVYEAVHAEGVDELERTSMALGWSALAGGLAMGFSFLVTGLIDAHLPHDAHWRPLISAFGYPIGFIIVILGRQQLFTENTLTGVVPVFTGEKSVVDMLRVWGMVLLGNVIGATLFALVIARLDVIDAETFEGLKRVAQEAHALTFAGALLRGIFGGWLIALVVWLLPFAESARLGVIFILTWIIGAAHFTHVVAGSVDGMFLVFAGERTLTTFLVDFFLPTLLGNIIGGVALVAALNHLQVKSGGGSGDEEPGEGIIIA